MTVQPHTFAVIGGRAVRRVLDGHETDLVKVVERAYRTHGEGRTVNPPSYFLRFADRPDARIIALPASVAGNGETSGVDGLKWISSFPGNIGSGLQRASAVLILNNPDDGFPFACLEASIISATRTAASAALAADHLTRTRARPRSIGFYGAGLIARYVHRFLTAAGFHPDQVGVFDAVPGYAADFAASAQRNGLGTVRTVEDGRTLVTGHDLVVFATTAPEPHVTDPTWFDHHPVVLHVSLRDLSVEVVLDSVNIVDDVDHCLRAGTSPHLAEQRTGDREFVTGTLYDVLTGQVTVPADRTVVFSPFGLGVLDLAVGRYVHDTASRSGDLLRIEDFFDDLRRDI
ncbi:MAG TPA: 2,3-diaminopropionate biosynthesis protein SbnB [Mycobacteriales bacterium]|nr:2,3-diaminopropionate biosynthesis protein SbnB [Mycobacteriales bacterium]